MKMKLIKFNSDAWYNDQLIAYAGETKLLDDSLGFASRWLRRGAELVETPEVKVQDIPVEEIPVEEIEVPEIKSLGKKKTKKKISL